MKKDIVKFIVKFIWEEMNLVQVLKAITQWLILLTLLYSAFKLVEIVRFLREIYIMLQ